MTCLWDKSWEPASKLPGLCDWVACLKPPPPPSFTNLRITDWNGKPIAFGNSAHYVCDRGFSFEEDPAQEEQTYTCQDGTAPDTRRGFFDVPDDEEDWPRCVRGKPLEVLKCVQYDLVRSPLVYNLYRYQDLPAQNPLSLRMRDSVISFQPNFLRRWRSRATFRARQCESNVILS